ncbi:hypothetical protein ATHEMM101B_04750 [Atlantibacter hermannii]
MTTLPGLVTLQDGLSARVPTHNRSNFAFVDADISRFMGFTTLSFKHNNLFMLREY